MFVLLNVTLSAPMRFVYSIKQHQNQQEFEKSEKTHYFPHVSLINHEFDGTAFGMVKKINKNFKLQNLVFRI